MTMQEVEYRTPNGLHDAYLLGLAVDYSRGILHLNLNWFVDIPDNRLEAGTSKYKTGSLLIHGLRYCVIEAPAKGLGEAPDQIYGFPTTSTEVDRCDLPTVDQDVFCHSIYVGQWQSFIHFAGTSADILPEDLLVRTMDES